DLAAGGGLSEVRPLALEWQLEGRAADVVGQDGQVVRVDQAALRRLAEKVVRVGDDELVERRRRGHQHGGGRTVAPTDPPDPLPSAGDAAGVAAQHAGFQATDVDAQLE